MCKYILQNMIHVVSSLMENRSGHVAVTLLLLAHVTTRGESAYLPTAQFIHQGPSNTTVSEGGIARLTCGVTNMVGDCQWTRDGFALGTDKALPDLPRYRMEGCDLVIEPVLPLDEGLYQCQVGGARGVAPVASEVAGVSVNCEPGRPYIVQGGGGVGGGGGGGEEVELHCQSQGGKPPAEIQWWDTDTGARMVADMREFATKMQDKKTWLTVSILKFTPHRPTRVHCTVFNDAFPSPKLSETIKINFKDYMKPKAQIFSANETLELQCEDTAETLGKQYKWIINGNEIRSETENTLKMLQINESYDNSKVKCLLYDSKKAEFVLINNFKLHFDKSKKDTKPITPTSPQALPLKNIVSLGNKTAQKSKPGKKQVTYTCVAEEEIEDDPKYIWIDGKLEESIPSRSDNGGSFRCTVVEGGFDKLKQMSSNLKGMSRKLRKFSKTLNQISRAMDGA